MSLRIDTDRCTFFISFSGISIDPDKLNKIEIGRVLKFGKKFANQDCKIIINGNERLYNVAKESYQNGFESLVINSNMDFSLAPNLLKDFGFKEVLLVLNFGGFRNNLFDECLKQKDYFGRLNEMGFKLIAKASVGIKDGGVIEEAASFFKDNNFGGIIFSNVYPDNFFFGQNLLDLLEKIKKLIEFYNGGILKKFEVICDEPLLALVGARTACMAGINFFHLSDGFIYPCPHFGIPIVGIRGLKIKEIQEFYTTSPLLHSLLERRIEGCGHCILRKEGNCGGGCRARALKDSGYFNGPDPLCPGPKLKKAP